MAGTRGCALLLALLQAQRARAPDVEALRARSCNFQTWDVPEQGPLPKEKVLCLVGHAMLCGDRFWPF